MIGESLKCALLQMSSRQLARAWLLNAVPATENTHEPVHDAAFSTGLQKVTKVQDKGRTGPTSRDITTIAPLSQAFPVGLIRVDPCIQALLAQFFGALMHPISTAVSTTRWCQPLVANSMDVPIRVQWLCWSMVVGEALPNKPFVDMQHMNMTMLPWPKPCHAFARPSFVGLLMTNQANLAWGPGVVPLATCMVMFALVCCLSKTMCGRLPHILLS